MSAAHISAANYQSTDKAGQLIKQAGIDDLTIGHHA